MSSSRATNSAKMRRAAEFKQPKPQAYPPNVAGGQSMQQHPPKMLISDAIALISLRLGKLENSFQTMEESGTGGDNLLINYDDVFEEILNRLTTIEEKQQQQQQQQQQQSSQQVVFDSSAIDREIVSLKDIVMRLQTMVIETNQRISSMFLTHSENQLQIVPQLSAFNH